MARRERGRAPRAHAARAGDELSDRALEAVADWALVLAGLRLALDERLADEVATRSRDSVRDASNVAAESAKRSSAVPAGARRARCHGRDPARKTPAIAA